VAYAIGIVLGLLVDRIAMRRASASACRRQAGDLTS
jgi:hypothetical protein